MSLLLLFGILLVAAGGTANFMLNRIVANMQSAGQTTTVIYPELAFVNNHSHWFILGGLVLILLSLRSR